MSSAIEWSLGLPCADQRDAILASVVEGPHAPTGAAAAEHLRRCPACRAFRDSLRTQRVLVRQVAQQQLEEQKKRERQRKLRGEMTEWVEQELRVRGERELARLLWRCGTALLRLDPAAARHVIAELVSGTIDETSIELLLTIASSNLASIYPQTGFRRTAMASTRASFLRFVDLFSRMTAPDLTVRVETMRMVADLAEAVSSSMSGPLRSLRAYVEWYHGSESLVPGLLQQALQCSSDSVQRAHAIANVALWNSEQGSFDTAIELGRESACACNRFATPRVNLAVWTTIIGDRRGADRHLAEAATIVGPGPFRSHWPWALVSGWLKSCLLITGASSREQAQAVDSMWIAYHRWGGLPPSSQANLIPLESESRP